GQISTHSVHPVQSSGATCSVYSSLFMFFHFGLALLKVAGAFGSSALSYTLARITACGHTITHLPHWMQSCSSHTGIICAMLRFSHCAVPVGNVPPAGSALTG